MRGHPLQNFKDMYIINSSRFTDGDLSDAFQFTVRMSAFEEMVLPISGVNDFTVYWGDETSNNESTLTHTYTNAGDYTISIKGNIDTFGFNDSGNKLNVIGLINWGDVGFKSLYGGFYGCSNLIGEIPTLNVDKLGVNLTTVNRLFLLCSGLTGSIPATFLDNCVNLTTVYQLFFGCSGLTGSIPATFLDNCVSLTTVQELFFGCSNLTGSIPATFLISNTLITNMSYVFYNCINLTGLAPEYWLNVQYILYSNCFTNDTLLDNYASILNSWKGL